MVFTTSVFAESAPVYDADSLPPFDQGADQTQSDLPPPPAPRQESRATEQEAGGFVPLSDQDFSASESRSELPRKAPNQAAAPAAAGSTTERLRRLEQQVNNIQTSEKNTKLDSLESQNQALRSELDQLNHQMQQLQKQLKAQTAAASPKNTESASAETSANQVPGAATASVERAAADVNKKSVTETKSAKASKPVKAASPKASDAGQEESRAPQTSPDDAQPNVQEEQQIYQTAYKLIKSKKYAEAISSLKEMLKKYPSGQFASNAHYWLGELYGLSGKNDQALSEFSIVVKNYSESPRVAEAQLKVGLIYASQSQWSEAKTALKKVVTHYPGTTSAKLAAEQLKQIKQVGH